MITADDCLKKYGVPTGGSGYMTTWIPDDVLRKGAVPGNIFCNKDLVKPLRQALTNLVARGLITELKTWDGCFNIRNVRGGTSWSLHSWGISVDVNAAENPLGKIPVLSPEFVKCWKDAGFDWGGNFRRLDGMHFQLARI